MKTIIIRLFSETSGFTGKNKENNQIPTREKTNSKPVVNHPEFACTSVGRQKPKIPERAAPEIAMYNS